ncbi:hypothetical protein K1719_035860 [Acacia pycnantha]|nr:hypothetical protein K1719_035860 [Acacia pycnantha]
MILSSLPLTPPPSNPAVNTATPTPPIPIPKYPPPRRSLKSQKPPPEPPKPTSNPGLKHHRNSKYFKPVKDGVIKSDDDRSESLLMEMMISSPGVRTQKSEYKYKITTDDITGPS